MHQNRMVGVGFRSEMRDWNPADVQAGFYEVAPENWVRRDREPLYRLRDAGHAVRLHGVSLSLGGQAPINAPFVREVRTLMDDLGSTFYSDHLAASGDAHQLYDLFPIPFTEAEVVRVSDRIRQVQDLLGCRMAVENTTYYTNIGELTEPEFLMRVAERADCGLLLDLNNITVNQKNHGTVGIDAFVAQIDLDRVTYLHVAGHEFDARFGLYIDTHSDRVERPTAQAAARLAREHGKSILLEWDNDFPSQATLNEELACLQAFTTT